MPVDKTDYTIGEVADQLESVFGDFSAGYYARQIRHHTQLGIYRPHRSGEGRTAAARFSVEDMAFVRLIGALAQVGVSTDHLAVAAKCRDNIPAQPAGELHRVGFAFVLDAIRRGEDWYFNLHLSRSGHHGGSFARGPEVAPELIDSFSTITLPCTSLLRPLLDRFPVDPQEPGDAATDEREPVSRDDQPHDAPPPPNTKGD